MKIAFVNVTTTVAFGGIETFHLEMARVLARRGHVVDLFAGRVREVPSELRGTRLRMYPFLRRALVPNFGTRFRKFVERLSFALFALPDLTSGRYDYLYVSKPFDLPAVITAARLSRSRVIFGSGGTEFFPGYCRLARRAHLVLACSSFNRDQISGYCGLEPRVLPNGVDTGHFRPLQRDDSLAASLHILPETPVIMTACRLVGWKGVQYALKALALLRRKGQRFQYLIAGDGEYRPSLETLTDELGLSGEVRFLGTLPRADLPKWYSLARVAVFPSVADEAFGIAIAEAMACGLPVVGTAVGGIPEVIGADGGMLVPPRDEQALADALRRLLTDEPLRQRIASGARDRAAAEFSWERVADLFESMIRHAGTCPRTDSGLPSTR